MEKFKLFLLENKIEHSYNVDLKSKTWIKTGGVALIWIVPMSIDQLEILGRYLYAENLKFEIVGQTSNLFFRSSYNPDIVISTIKLKDYNIIGDKVICDCGVSISKLSREFVRVGYEGYFGLVDLPGTVAAAVYNNSGCLDCSVSSLLYSIDILTVNGVETFYYDSLMFSKRSSVLKQKKLVGIVLKVTLKVVMSNSPIEELNKSQLAHEKRVMQQEGAAKNLGSVYSKRVYKNDIKGIFVRAIKKIFNLNSLQQKRLMLIVYGYKHLDKYISDKNINTYIWQDANAELLFEDYKKFINTVFKKAILEIEIKDGK